MKAEPERIATTSRAATARVAVLAAVYAMLLVGVVLFKFPFNYQLDESGRALNLIPFAGSFEDHRGFGESEVIENVLIFVPFGVYLSMLAREWSVIRKILTVVAASVAFELIQFTFAMGRADVTDVVGNTAGGALGIGIVALSARMLGVTRSVRVLIVVEAVVTVLALAFFLFLRAHSR